MHLIVTEGIDDVGPVNKHTTGVKFIEFGGIGEDRIKLPGHAFHLSCGQIKTSQFGHMPDFFLSYFHDFAKEKRIRGKLFALKPKQLVFIQRTGGKDNPRKDLDQIGIKL